MKFKKIAATVLAAVSLVFAMAVPVSADSIFDTAKNIDSGKKVTKTLDEGDTIDYKFTPTEKGTATIKLTAKTNCIDFFVYDEDGNELDFECDASLGTKNNYNNKLYWNKNAETFKGNLSFEVKANKTYYVQIKRYDYSLQGSGKFEASFTYPTGETAPSALMSLTLKKGDTVQLGANGDNAKWSTSKKSVATVSSNGLIKAVKKGKAVITLKCGSKTQTIEIVVE